MGFKLVRASWVLLSGPDAPTVCGHGVPHTANCLPLSGSIFEAF